MITNGPTANNQLVPQPRAPPGWGNDELAKFLDMTRSNVFASFVQTPQHYAKLLDVDSAFLRICKNLTDPPDFWAPLFLLKAHSSYRAAVGLAMAGQAPEAFMVMRGCLESALYGLYINRNKHAFEIWVKRNDSEEAKRAVRKEFTVAAMWKCLKSVDEKLQDEAQTLYQRTIDLGAHPNAASVATALKMSKGEKGMHFQLTYLSADPQMLRGTMKSTAQVGVTVLGIFRHVLNERYNALGLAEKLKDLRQDL